MHEAAHPRSTATPAQLLRLVQAGDPALDTTRCRFARLAEATASPGGVSLLL
jgi:hypothetical protein